MQVVTGTTRLKGVVVSDGGFDSRGGLQPANYTFSLLDTPLGLLCLILRKNRCPGANAGVGPGSAATSMRAARRHYLPRNRPATPPLGKVKPSVHGRLHSGPWAGSGTAPFGMCQAGVIRDS